MQRIRRRGAIVSLGLGLTATTACEDATTDPLARLVAEETAGALVLGVDLPDPGSWTVPHDAAPVAADAVAGWLTSWDLPADEGRRARALTYEPLAALFVPELGRGGIGEQLDRLSLALARAEELPAPQLPEHIRARMSEASRTHARAMDALRAERLQEATIQLLAASDALREVGPEAVARTMVSEADAGFRRIPADGTYSERDLERLERLVRGGREALSEQDWVRAIRRAYYARGLLASGGS